MLFSPGDPADSVLYLQAGHVKLSVVSHTGREAVVAMPGCFIEYNGALKVNHSLVSVILYD